MMPTFEVQMQCPKCGFVRPHGQTEKQCSQCGVDYVPKPVMSKKSSPIVAYTKEYQDKNWEKCRFGKDLRSCIAYHSLKINGDFIIHCNVDGAPCNAKWNGEKGES